jgi:hypothetical protein
MTQTERQLSARIAAHERWARAPDRSAATAPARAALLAKFEQQVDPDGALSPDERAIRAEHARKAHFASLALRSARGRRRSHELASAVCAASVSELPANAHRPSSDVMANSFSRTSRPNAQTQRRPQPFGRGRCPGGGADPHALRGLEAGPRPVVVTPLRLGLSGAAWVWRVQRLSWQYTDGQIRLSV